MKNEPQKIPNFLNSDLLNWVKHEREAGNLKREKIGREHANDDDLQGESEK